MTQPVAVGLRDEQDYLSHCYPAAARDFFWRAN